MANLKKTCAPKACPEAIVDDVPCGPRDCMPMKDCAEVKAAVEEEVKKA